MQQYQMAVSQKLKQCQETKKAVLLAIETSCDETAAAVVSEGRIVHSNVLYSQIAIHREYGGVVPEIASRSHVEKMQEIVSESLHRADMTLDNIDAIAVTSGPGLIGCLLVGLSYAKGLSIARQLPLIAVHHIRGHICANYLACPDLKPPFLCLVVSGGHSHLIAVESLQQMRVVGRTRDDAAGEAFDKVARVLGLPYPGGPELERLAHSGNPDAMAFSGAFHLEDHYDFSFSGMKTAVLNRINQAEQKGEKIVEADIAASFQQSVVAVLVDRAIRACKNLGYQTLALAGGVASNELLRATMEEQAEQAGLSFICPPKNLCTDNAAMIGCAGFDLFMDGQIADLSLNGRANWPIEES